MVHVSLQFIILIILQLISLSQAQISTYLNATGGTFPANAYIDATFAYSFVESTESVTYFPLGSTTGKCNIQGYWHTGNTEAGAPSSTVKQRDTNICTDKCTVATCGFSSVTNPREDAASRHPLNDWGASDSTLKTADYTAFPDLVNYPAVGGAVVPIYNIPELVVNSSNILVLSRSSITNIFLGNIRFWNDSRLVKDNVGEVKTILSTLNKPITFVVRTDSSGTSEIFSTALATFDPARTGVSYDASFYTSVGFGTTPSWCGKLTDEIQYITISGCDSSLSTVEKTVEMYIVGFDYNLRLISFTCDITSQNFKELYSHSNGNNKTVHVDTSSVGTTVTIRLGFLGSVDTALNTPSNWYQPYVLNSTSTNLQVSFSTLQEGGYLNVHYSYASKPYLPEIRSLWINIKYTFDFSISYNGITYPSNFVATATQSLNVTFLTVALNNITSSLISTVALIKHTGSEWYQYKITFKTPTVRTFVPNPFVLELLTNTGNFIPIALTTLQNSNNYPIFYNTKVVYGLSNSGIYTCYKREQNYSALNYHTGNLNPGVASEVAATKYSIGYSVLDDALQFNLSKANMINLAGYTVTATADSVAYAVLENGGNLNSQFVALLVDGKSNYAWPISGYTYFLLRKKDHIGDCTRRQQALEFLYNFYHSTTVQTIAKTHGFATLPEFIRDIIVNNMIDTIYCKDSNIYALAKYRVVPIPMLATKMLYVLLGLYLNVYQNVDSSASFSISQEDNSIAIWNTYIQSPQTYVGAFVSFSDLYTKQQYYLSTQEEIIVTPFTHYSIVMIYHLNAFSSSTLHLTKDIIIGILLGEITYWNDPLIQRANSNYKSLLPNQRIIVVTQSNYSDNNVILSRFLAMNNQTIKEAYDLSIHGNYSIPFGRVLDSNYHIDVANELVDRYVTHYDGTIGYHNLLYGLPNSYISNYCHDPDCDVVVKPGSDNGQSLNFCQLDDKTSLQISSTVSSYDLMLSTNASCYPIAGTIDFVTYAKNNSNTCTYVPINNSSVTRSVTNDRVKFSAWLYNGSVVTNPLTNTYSVYSAPAKIRLESYTNLCNIECSYQSLGYKYCEYRNCSWADGDFYQTVSLCDGKKQSRTVTYTLYDNRDCLNKNPLSSVTIPCTYIASDSSIGIVAYIICSIGVTICLTLLILTYRHRQQKIIKKSQPIFIYIFIVGSIFLCLTIIAYIGPNNNFSCLGRPWFFNMSSTIMFAPLIMKLRRIDVLFNNPRLKKIKVTDRLVLSQVLGILVFDIILLLIWTFAERPEVKRISTTKYSNVLDPVDDMICTYGLKNYMEIALVIYKALLIIIGIYLAVTTWHVPSDLSEAKYFAVAIYNIAMVGGLAYFLGDYLIQSTSEALGVFLQCLGMFLGAIVSGIVIMTPKLLVVEGITQVKPGDISGGESSMESQVGGSSRPKSSFPSNGAFQISIVSENKRKSVMSNKIVVNSHASSKNSRNESNNGIELISNEKDI